MSDRNYSPPLPAAHSFPGRRDGATPGLLPQLRIALAYFARHRRLVHCHRPERFTDWIQWRKLYDRDARMPPLADKVAVKAHVATVLGPEWVTPTLYHGRSLPLQPQWTPPFVVKARHGCNQSAFVRTGDEDWAEIRAAAGRWMDAPYGALLDEWLYRHVPPGVLVEPFLGNGRELPIDYKIYVFGSKAMCVKVDQDREHSHWRAIYDLDWRPIWAPKTWRHPPPPASLADMIAAAETLGRAFDFVRADFYELDGRPRFGELTFYPGSGLSRLPDDLDYWLGGLWSEARSRSQTRR